MIQTAFELQGKVEAVLITAERGTVMSEIYGHGSLVTTPVPKIRVVRGYGIQGDRHAGPRLADVRDRGFLAHGLHKGTEIANFREYSAVSTEELTEIVENMKLPAGIPAGCLGENLILSGIPRLSQLPPGTMLFFRKDEKTVRSAVLAVWEENRPCQGPGDAIQERFPQTPHLASRFPKAAQGKRGIVGCIFSSGNIHAGDTVVVKVPQQQMYCS